MPVCKTVPFLTGNRTCYIFVSLERKLTFSRTSIFWLHLLEDRLKVNFLFNLTTTAAFRSFTWRREGGWDGGGGEKEEGWEDRRSWTSSGTVGEGSEEWKEGGGKERGRRKRDTGGSTRIKIKASGNKEKRFM